MPRVLTEIILFGAAYLCAAVAGRWLALEPSGLLPLVPEAGLAVAALALRGLHLAAGVLVAECLLAFAWDGVGLPGIGAAALRSLQYLGVGWIARRWLWDPTTALGWPPLGRLLMAAPLCGLVAAGLAPLLTHLPTVPDGGTLTQMGFAGLATAFGTMATLPPTFLALTPVAARQSIGAPALLGVMVGILLLVGTAYFSESTRAAESLQVRLQDRSDEAARQLNRSLQSYIVALRAVEALFASSNEVTREHFDVFSRSLQKPLPGLYAVAWDAYVSAADKSAFEQRMQATGLPDFRIFEMDPQGNAVPVPDRPYYVPVAYARYEGEPLKALGYDMASEPTRKAALDHAVLTGDPTASGRIKLVTDPDPGYDILILMTMRGADTRTLIGYSGLAVRVSELAAAALEGVDPRLVARFYDRSATAEQQWLHGAEPDWHGPRNSATATTRLPVAGRIWEIELTAPPQYLADYFPVRAVLMLWGGLLVGLVLVKLVLQGTRPARLDDIRA